MYKLFLKKILISTISFLFILTAVNCNVNENADPDPEENPRGKIIEQTLKLDVNSATLDIMLEYSGINIDFDLLYDVQAYKIIYQTIDANGYIILASGTIFTPKMANNCPLLSLQHGTIAKQDKVPSEDPGITPESFMLASEGFVVCVPDYLGLGVSQGIHPFLHAKLSSVVAIDFLRASKNFCAGENISLNGQLFLAGYSEGGYVTLAIQKELEQNYTDEFNITAVAPMAGPYDLKNNALFILNQNNYPNPAYISYQIVAYNSIYNWNRLSDIFNPPYADLIDSYFSGNFSISEINGLLPKKINELLTESFLTDVLNGAETDLHTALEENSLLNWTPKAPIRFYHGDDDTIVPFFNSETAVEKLKKNGGNNIELITINGGGHSSSFFPCFILAHNWFRSF